MPPVYGQRPKPLEPLELDRRTLVEVARVLGERLAQLDAFKGRCPSCHDAEASALLARLRRVLDAIDRGTSTQTRDGNLYFGRRIVFGGSSGAPASRLSPMDRPEDPFVGQSPCWVVVSLVTIVVLGAVALVARLLFRQ